MEEIRLIEYIRKRAGKPGKGVRSGIGDDCAVFGPLEGKYLLWAADMLAEGTHFNAKKDGYERIGRKAVAVNISDIAAMGGVPAYITVSIGIPRGAGDKAVKGVYDGIFSICRKYGIKVVGGDTVRAGQLVIDVSVMGWAAKKGLVTRSGARKGDLVLVTGPVRDGRKEHLDFTPRLKEAGALVRGYKLGAMIDTSDGIAPDIGRICAESRVGCRLYADAIPLSEGLALKDAMHYGESFELLFTMGPKEARKLFLDLKKKKKRCAYFVIGEIVSKEDGMVLVGKEGRETRIRPEGYRHL